MCQQRVWVIGDEALAGALCQALSELPGSCLDARAWVPGDPIEAVHQVVVLAEGQRRNRVGLQLFEEALADPLSAIRHVVVLSFQDVTTLRDDPQYDYLLEPEGFLTVERLPRRVAQVDGEQIGDTDVHESAPSICDLLTAEGRREPDHEAKWILLAFEAAQRRVEVTSSGYRHAHKNLIAAVRIYLGALLAGDAPLDCAPRVLDRLRDLEEAECLRTGSSTVIGLDSASLLRHIGDAGCLLEQALRAQVLDHRFEAGDAGDVWRSRQNGIRRLHDHRVRHSERLKQVCVRLVDDCSDRLGWAVVLQQFVPKICCHRRIQEFMDLSPEVWRHTDLLLLDCDLGDTYDGLDALKGIRKESLDLPVVMMTAFDDARLAIEALRCGCNGFFAKSLDDPGDRGSLDYYLRLAEAVCRPDWEGGEGKLRDCWHRYAPLETAIGEYSTEARYGFGQVFHQLFALADGNADDWALRAWDSADTPTAEQVAQWLTMDVVGTLEHSFDSLRASGSGMPRLGSAQKEVTDCLNAATHGDLRQVSPDCAVLVLAWCLDAIAEAVQEQAAGERGCDAPEFALDAVWGLREAGDEARPRSSETFRKGHLEDSAYGAVQFLAGHLRECYGVDAVTETATSSALRVAADNVHQALEDLRQLIPADAKPDGFADGVVLLVDDDAELTGWKDALETVFSSRPGLRPRTNLKHKLGESEPHMVLLDLFLSTDRSDSPAECGLEYLRWLRREHPWLPVIVISASVDTVAVLKCIREGAVGYLPRYLRGDTTVADWADACTRHKALLAAALAQGHDATNHAKTIWRDVQQQRKELQGWYPRAKKALPRLAADCGGDSHEALATRIHQFVLAAYEHYSQGLALRQSVSGDGKASLARTDDWRANRLLWGNEGRFALAVLDAARAAELMAWILYKAHRYSCNKEQWSEAGKTGPWIAKIDPQLREKCWTPRVDLLGTRDSLAVLATEDMAREALLACSEGVRLFANHDVFGTY